MKRPYQILLPLLSIFLVRVDLTDLWPLKMLVEIEKVYDGDTVLLRYGQHRLKLRFSKIDAPEMGQPHLFSSEDAGMVSQRCLKKILREKKYWVLFPEKNDLYGRMLGDLEGVSFKLIKQGCVSLYPHANFSSKHEKFVYLRALQVAKREHLGIWKSGIRQPKSWRKTKKRFSHRH